MKLFPPEFETLKRISRELGETNDCVPLAVSLCYEIGYIETLRMFTEAGRRARKGTYWFETEKVFDRIRKERGIGWSRIFLQDDHGMTFKNAVFHPKIQSCGVYILGSTNHAAAFVNGRVFDWSNGRALRVTKLYQIHRENKSIASIF